MTERKEKFTPGPWEYDKYSLYVDSVPRVAEEYSEEICEVSGCRKQDEANGYLIAAAPEMYNSTKDLAECLAEVFTATINGDELPEALIYRVQEEVEKAANILKKARGEEC